MEPDTGVDLIGTAIALGVPAYLVLQVLAVWRIRDRWRIAAFAPLVLAVPIALFCIVALIAQSNLWPLTFILFAPFGALYLAALLGLHALRKAV